MQILSYILVFLALIVIYFLITAFWACISVAPWVPSKKKDLERAFKLARLKPGEVFYDLGCGDGRLVFLANEKFGAKAIGVETSLFLFLFCEIRRVFQGNKEVVFKNRSMFKEDLSRADVIYVYLLPKSLEKKLRDKLKKELKPGARVVSYVFAIKGLEPEVVDKPDEKSNPIYLYRF